MDKFKKLSEQREAYRKEMREILDAAEAEERALTEEETSRFDELEKKIKEVDRMVEAEERARNLEKKKTPGEEKDPDEEQEEQEERAFENYIRGTVSEERADVNLKDGSNGAILPKTIAQKIISKVIEISPIYQLADRYPTGGTVSIPYYDESTNSMTVGYATEFTDLESSSGTFKSIDLKGFLAGVLTKVSKSLVNNSSFDVVGFVVNKMAEKIAAFIEGECLNGTTDKIAGLSGASQIVKAAASTAITADELIDVQEKVSDRYQAGTIWIMSKATRTAIRKLKDNDGNYLLNRDVSAKWGYTLLGAPVYCSDNAKEMAAGNKVIFYGDMSGLAVQVSEDMEIEVLRERYAPQHAIGVVGFIEVDAKVADQQKISVLQMKASE